MLVTRAEGEPRARCRSQNRQVTLAPTKVTDLFSSGLQIDPKTGQVLGACNSSLLGLPARIFCFLQPPELAADFPAILELNTDPSRDRGSKTQLTSPPTCLPPPHTDTGTSAGLSHMPSHVQQG